MRYLQGAAAPGELTEASDIFALGLIYAEYLTGAMPPFDTAYHEPAIAVLHGQPLIPGPSRAPTSVIDLVERMLLPDPVARPSVAQVHSTLMNLRGGAATSMTARAPIPIRTPIVPRDRATTGATTSSPTPGTRRVPGGTPSVLRGKGVRIAGGTTATGAPVPAASAPPPPPAPHASTTPHPESPEHVAERPEGRGRALLGKLLGKLDERRAR